jgi:hypothetical protein
MLLQWVGIAMNSKTENQFQIASFVLFIQDLNTKIQKKTNFVQENFEASGNFTLIYDFNNI